MPPTPQIYQNLIDEDSGPIEICGPVLESQLTLDSLQSFLEAVIGLSPAYTATGKLSYLAVSDQSHVLIVQFHGTQTKSDSTSKGRSRNVNGNINTAGRKLLQDHLLCRPVGDMYAFDFGPLALSLYLDHGLRITNGVDIQSACPTRRARDPLASIKFAAGDAVVTHDENIIPIFEDMALDSNDPKRTVRDIAQRAWISHRLSQISDMEHRFQTTQRVDTQRFDDNQLKQLKFLAKITRDAQRLDQMKPTQVTNDVTLTQVDTKNRRVHLKQNDFHSRMRNKPDSDQRMSIAVGDHGTGFVLPAKTKRVNGRTAQLLVTANLSDKNIKVTTYGRDDPTNSEAQKALYVLSVLQGKVELLDENPWIYNIWLTSGKLVWPEDFFAASPSTNPLPAESFSRPLNDSQLTAVNHMLSRTPENCITLIQGPPGTGKTSVIAAYVEAAICAGQQGIWLVAQSNVAVKNIAEKLSTSTMSLTWKLLVSKDFHHEWHEHLYQKIQGNIIRSDRFTHSALRKELRHCQVVLCTLSMLSNDRLQAFTDAVPINTLVVDEASQIVVGDYTSVFSRFLATLRKVCFIGDDKQLPPFGYEENPELQSIFEIAHMRNLAVFLDTQYRMPPQIGRFISDAVYDGQLCSNLLHPITEETMACHFVDVCSGQEQLKGKSYQNVPEKEAVLQIAQRFQEEGRNYRIITPYDTQRTTIEDDMKTLQLDWKDKVFNVDSFQGNEDDYIIISLVRSRELGFLKDIRRTNVMLTRCKRGMIICTGRAFMKRDGAKSLVGQLLAFVGESAWVDVKDLEEAEL